MDRLTLAILLTLLWLFLPAFILIGPIYIRKWVLKIHAHFLAKHDDSLNQGSDQVAYSESPSPTRGVAPFHGGNQ